MSYTIITDSSCDLTQQQADELGLVILPLCLSTENGETYANYLDGREIGFHEYYEQLRSGLGAKTSAPGVGAFVEIYEKILQKGDDILYLGFSSALSGTYNAGAVAADEIREKYPEKKIYTVDTLCASMGQGLMVYLAAMKKNQGATLEEVRDYVEENKLHLCHWFTVTDLHFLHRGGRVSKTTAVVGSMLNVKPVMHVDDLGRLTKVGVVRGRKGSIAELKSKMAETAINPKEQTIFISHGDCLEEAKYLGEMIEKEIGVKEIVYNYVGPVIGTHSGPGTIALFFLGTKR